MFWQSFNYRNIVLTLFELNLIKLIALYTIISFEIDRIPFRSSADSMDTALSMFTGDKEVEFRGG